VTGRGRGPRMTAAKRKAAFMAWIAGHFFLRFHMTLILGGTFLAGLLVTRMFLDAGNTSLALRYGVAVAASYAVFLLLINLWLWYVGVRSDDDATDPGDAVDALDLASDIGTGLRPAGQVNLFDAGGGSFGGGGSTGSFGESAAEGVSGLVGDADDAGCAIVVVLLVAALVLTVGVAGAYLVWAAPGILAEAAFEAFLASALLPGARRSEAQGWLQGTVRATVVPFAIMMVAAVGFGWAAGDLCPKARRMADVIECARHRPAAP
jgi:hypothetical protein